MMRRRFGSLALVTAALIAFISPIAAQQPQQQVVVQNGIGGNAAPGQGGFAPSDPDVKFDAASIKPNTSGPGRGGIQVVPGRFQAVNMPVRQVFRQAFRAQDFQIIGAPDWFDAERYDVIARPPDGSNPGQFATMLQNLLRERFKLQTHVETREVPIYSLVMARSDGRLGPNLKPSTTDCQAVIAAARGRGFQPPAGPPDAAPPPQCGMRSGLGQIVADSAPLTQLLQTLQQFLQRPVVDNTKLTGLYSFELRFSPEGIVPPLAPGPGGPPPPAADPNLPTLITAVQEQLGLKLESTRGPVDVLVIDHIERPVAG